MLFITALKAGADCGNARLLSEVSSYCSGSTEFSNDNAEKTSWFKFIAVAADININVSGKGSGGTLVAPVIRIYSDCKGTELVGTGISENNVTSLYKGGLVTGATYYIAISGENKKTGTFQLCLNNYNPVLKAGQDCATASYLCSTQTISQSNVSGAGTNSNEAAGTCLNADGLTSESNSVWYKWQAANSGTLVFTITPNSIHDDIDWVLFDLGTTGDCANVKAANAIRCKAGYGVDNIDCPGDSIYFKTGLDFRETDLSEPPGCGKGQNGKVKFITMLAGHVYGLLVNNFSSGNNGFTLSFTDQAGKAGTGEFVGPRPVIAYSGTNDCTATQQHTFTSLSTGYETLQWSFGEGASMASATTPGPHRVTYTTPGLKTITLTTQSAGGCQVIATKQITVGFTPALPQIQLSKPAYCLNDTARLSAVQPAGTGYKWTGPNNFRSDSAVAVIPVTGSEVAGTYNLTITYNQCSSAAASVELPAPLPSPVAAFDTDPSNTTALYGPLAIQFKNRSVNADSYLWDFGDGTTSTESEPGHTYNNKGEYTVKLTATKSNSCFSSVSKANLAIIQLDNYIFIPNAFSPNGDGINDTFKVTITNIKAYHIRIFNRWGQQLFESNDINNSWDGMYKGQAVPFGVFYYELKSISNNGNKISRGGCVTLLR
ncbi:gliding motility-associated C-terminal domain-containing protein [Mucilaginibacter sp. AW1-7]|uniref:gliding motility-associated C-terminal domain-containing protein n=1 Tax=Mucilaginibacter sp. AW1-7 TaxID=3349874 RepID=UPI003F740E37